VPRTADHELRGREIAAAVYRLVAAGGIDAATVAAVAREAGHSVGLVQHYFRSKDELLLHAYSQVTTDIGTRVAAHIREGEARQGTILEVVRACVWELLPLDQRRREEYRVTRAFLGRSLADERLAEVAAATTAAIRGELARAVGNGRHCGEVTEETDADLAAMTITALVNGLADQLHQASHQPEGPGGPAATPHDVSSMTEAVLDACLAAVFTGECRHYA
jgi:AcrR family transcriptional regulator